MMKYFSFKVALVALLPVIIALMSAPSYANQDDLIKQQIRQDKDYDTNVAKARSMLQARSGYQVKDIQADAYNGQKLLDVEAYKGAVRYEIKLTYPELKISKEKANK